MNGRASNPVIPSAPLPALAIPGAAPEVAATPQPLTGLPSVKPDHRERKTIIVKTPPPTQLRYTFGPGTVWVHGYTKKNGIVVNGYCRAAPSQKGN